MNLVSPKDVRALLDALGVRPSKAKGQNFLVDRNVLQIILDAAELQSTDVVLEVGPGLGVLTSELLQRVSRVIAIELDDRLHKFLRKQLGMAPGLELIHSDVMDIDLHDTAARVDRVVANLPYSVGSRVLMDLVTAPVLPRKIVVTVQLEVAERLVAGPGTGDYGIMAVWSNLAYSVSIRKKVSNRCFLPNPDVSSAIVEFSPRSGGALIVRDPAYFRALTKYAFMQRRKQLAGLFASFADDRAVSADRVRAALDELGVDQRSRPEQLSAAEWCALVNLLTPCQPKA